MTAAPGPQQPDEVRWKPGDPCPACGAKERGTFGQMELCSTLTGRDHKVRWAGPMSHRRKLSRPQLGRTDGGCPTCGVAPGERCRSVGGRELIGQHVERPAAPSAQPAECSAVCDRMACEWCPGHDRHEATAQWLYKAVIARQNKVPADDLTPWSELTKDQRNGWRAWADELIPIVLYGIPVPAQPVRDTEEGRR